jgi:hypothetical protein
MKRIQLIILNLLLSSCSLGKKGVFYDEMNTPPILTITDKILTVKTTNSVRHSALLLYKIETEVNKERGELNLFGLQAANKKYRSEFEIELDKIGIDDLDGWNINWIDPDGTKHELKI